MKNSINLVKVASFIQTECISESSLTRNFDKIFSELLSDGSLEAERVRQIFQLNSDERLDDISPSVTYNLLLAATVYDFIKRNSYSVKE